MSESVSVQFQAPERVGKFRPPHFPPNHVRLTPWGTELSMFVGIYSLSLSPHNEQGPQLVICLFERAEGFWQLAKQAAKLGRSGKGVERNVRDLTVNMEWRQWCSYSPAFPFTWWHKKEGEENLLNETWHSLIKVWFRLQQSFCFVCVSVLPHHGQPNRIK